MVRHNVYALSYLFRPKYIDLESQAENLTPEAFASFPSKGGREQSWLQAKHPLGVYGLKNTSPPGVGIRKY
jgi:hypothetical protein